MQHSNLKLTPQILGEFLNFKENSLFLQTLPKSIVHVVSACPQHDNGSGNGVMLSDGQACLSQINKYRNEF